MKCSSGFYVRQLVHDLGSDLGCGALAYTINRTQQGPFTLENSLTEEDWTPERISQVIRFV